ncbi:hypothetical protein Tco_0617006 [Tanacetum coccineum]
MTNVSGGQNADDNEDERVVLAKLIANLKLDIDENKKIQKQLRKSYTTLTYELNESKSTLTDSNDILDSLILPYGDGLYSFNLGWGKLIQKLQQKEVDEESCVKTCSMNWGEANSFYTNYIVSSASNGKIQAGALIFVLIGYIENQLEKRQEDKWQKPITHEITVLVKNLLILLAAITKANANKFEIALKEEMFDDLQYVQSLEKEVDKLESEKNEFSNEYDLLLQDYIRKNILCVTYMSMLDIDNYCDMACKYLEKIKECERLKLELSKQNEFLKIKPTNFSNHSFESDNICLKKTVAHFQKDFKKLEAHCVALELNNQTLQFGQHGLVLKEVNENETINIELEHSMDKLLQENENLHMEREHLK